MHLSRIGRRAGKQLTIFAISNNVDITDVVAIGQYLLAQGYDARYVDEFLPASLGLNRWLYFDWWQGRVSQS
ncbi:hypothetical protein BH10CYA1_BH10CYA1_30530 [soil metagenome]